MPKKSPSKVYFLPWERRDELPAFIERSGAMAAFHKKDRTAVKMHFGEKGNDGFVHPEFIRPFLKALKDGKVSAFLTDTCTIYNGPRNNAIGHLNIAVEHGFSHTRLHTPVIIADGLAGKNDRPVKIVGTHFSEVKIAADIAEADSILVISHFKGHLLTGFGGAVKNLGMGCASRRGKFEMHSSIAPTVDISLCKACGVCVKECPHGALALQDKVALDKKLCKGCGECVTVCPTGALSVTWDENTGSVQEKVAEYAKGAVTGKRIFCFNFVNHVTANCDCMSKNETPLVPDIGIFASEDPVAIDKASLDAVIKAGGDVFKKAHPHIVHDVQLRHAEKIGLGVTEYELVER